jgi:hypothetical protein
MVYLDTMLSILMLIFFDIWTVSGWFVAKPVRYPLSGGTLDRDI